MSISMYIVHVDTLTYEAEEISRSFLNQVKSSGVPPDEQLHIRW